MIRNKSVLSTAFIFTTIVLVSFFVSPYIHAMSSTNVSLERDLYRDMELWAAEGLITGNLYRIRFDGQVFGHHARGDADDIFLEWFHSINNVLYKLASDRERSGIKMRPATQIKNQFSSETGYRFNPHSSFTLKYAYEEIKNADNIPDLRQRNHYVGLEAALYF